MPCLSKSLQPSKKPWPRVCSYNPKPGACRTVPQPSKDPQESTQPVFCFLAIPTLPFCSIHPLSWSCKHAHASQGHTHTQRLQHLDSTSGKPYEPLTAGSTKGRGQASLGSLGRLWAAHSTTHTCKAMEWSPHLQRYWAQALGCGEAETCVHTYEHLQTTTRAYWHAPTTVQVLSQASGLRPSPIPSPAGGEGWGLRALPLLPLKSPESQWVFSGARPRPPQQG